MSSYDNVPESTPTKRAIFKIRYTCEGYAEMLIPEDVDTPQGIREYVKNNIETLERPTVSELEIVDDTEELDIDSYEFSDY